MQLVPFTETAVAGCNSIPLSIFPRERGGNRESQRNMVCMCVLFVHNVNCNCNDDMGRKRLPFISPPHICPSVFKWMCVDFNIY